MRVLFVPVFNYPSNLNADSIYNISGDWCRRLCDADPDIAVYRLLPEQGLKGVHRFEYDYEPVHPRVHDLFVPMLTRYDLEEANGGYATYGQFHPILGDYPVNAVICTSAIKTVMLKRLFTSGGGSSYPPTFYNFELLIRGLGTNEVSQVSEDEMVMQGLGEIMAFNLFESPKCARIAQRSARRFLSATMAERIMTDSAMVYSGYNEETSYVVPKEEKNDVFTVMVRGRMTTSKNIEGILDMYNRFMAAGRKVKIQGTTGDVRSTSEAVEEELHKNSTIEILRVKSKDEACAIMRKAHAFLFWSSHELFAVSVWEMMASGLIGVFKRADWLDGLLPKEYPYVFNTEEEAYVMLADIYDNYDRRVEELRWMVEFVRDQYSYVKTSKIAANVIRGRQKQNKIRDWLPEMLAEHGTPKMSLTEMIEVIAANAQMGRSVLKGRNAARLFQSIGVTEMCDAAKKAGYQEDLASKEPVFTRLTNGSVLL